MTLTDFDVAIIDGDTHLSKWVLEHRRLDVQAEYCRTFSKYIPIGGVVCDVGACLGDHTLSYVQMVGEKGRVYAFEPNPSAHTCLCYNMLKFVNVSCYQMALGETPGIGIIADSKNLNAGASMVKRTGSGDVLIMTLDSMAHKWDRLDFIKIDAEGSEPEIILGALQTLRRLRPVILIEISRQVLKYRGYTSEDITAPLNRLGYRVEPAESHLPLSGENVDAICFPR